MKNTIKIKEHLKKSFMYPIWVACISPLYTWYKIWKWKDGQKTPPPHYIKRKSILQLQKKYGIKTFIETGTFRGEMVDAVKDKFSVIYSIELDKTLFEKARDRFSAYPHIKILLGDSSQNLPIVLSKIHEPVLFWLDGHYSAGITAKGNLNTPIMKELGCILKHSVKNHVVIIDDARHFIGENDYPTIEELTSFVAAQNKDLRIEVENDSIRILPGSPLGRTEPTLIVFVDFVKKFLGTDEPIIADVGSRDGQESVAFANLFPKGRVYSFECNEETLPLCRTNVEKTPNMHLIETAVSDVDGFVTFHPIDTEKSITTWKDGNPGCSSLFLLSSENASETFVQKEVRVPSVTMRTFMHENTLPRIDILWMDIQGSELLAFKGFGDRLRDIGFIHTEVEFIPIYNAQPLFADVKKYMQENGFVFVGFTYKDKSAGDAVFVNKHRISLYQQMRLSFLGSLISLTGKNRFSPVRWKR